MNQKRQIKLTKKRYKGMLPSVDIFTKAGQVRVNYLENKIKEFRENERVSQYKLAFSICISRQALSKIERGEVIPSVLVALKLAQYFEVPVENLFQTDWEFFDIE